MSRLGNIPVRVEFEPRMEDSSTIGGGVTAILGEIAMRLECLAADGVPGAIDLRTLPMSADDRRRLSEALGEGEASILLEIDGVSSIRETGVPGVWWNEHHDRSGRVTADYIEIASVPAILPVETGEISRAAADLRMRAENATVERGAS